jgi:ABC-type sugar transport system ATPase subunit
MTGLMGAGHDQVPYALFGALEHTDGTITIKNKKYEKEDNTAGTQTYACSGDKCEIVDLTK